MKTIIAVIFLIFSAACSAESQKVAEIPKTETLGALSKPLVLVELFTSEG